MDTTFSVQLQKLRKEKGMKQKVLYAIIAVLAVAAIVFGALYFTNDADKTAQIDKLTGEKTAHQILSELEKTLHLPYSSV
mgnify:CR=1 FL=1